MSMHSGSCRTKRFLSGLRYGYLFQAIVIAVGIWLPPFFLKHLGSEPYGLWLAGLQITAYLALLDLGMTALIPREVARIAAGPDSNEVARLAGRAFQILVVQLPLVAAAAAVCWQMLPKEWDLLRQPLAFMLAFFVAVYPLRLFPALVQGVQDLAFHGRAHIASWVAGTLVTVILVASNAGMLALPAGWITQQAILLGLCTARWRIRFRTYWPRRVFTEFDWVENRRLLAHSVWLTLAQLATALSQGTDILVIGHLMGPTYAVIYACTGKIAMVLANQPQMLLTAALPGLSELRASGDRDRLLNATTALRDGVLLGSGAVVCVVAAMNGTFVSWWVGPEFFGGFGLTILLLGAMFLRHLNSTLCVTMFSLGMERRLLFTLLGDGLVTLAASIVFVKEFGLAGAPMGSILGVALISLPANIYSVSAELGTGLAPYLTALSSWMLRLAAVVGALVALLPTVRMPAGALQDAIAPIAAIGLYAAVFLPLAARGPLRGYLRPLQAR